LDIEFESDAIASSVSWGTTTKTQRLHSNGGKNIV
jgi:hypothetical protein